MCPQTWQATLSTLASAGFNLSLADGGPGNDTLTRLASFINAVTSSGEINGRGGIDKLTLNFKIVNQTITSDLSPGSVTLYDGFTVTGCETVDYKGGNGVGIIISATHALGAAVNLVNGAGNNDVLTASAAGAALDGGIGDDQLIGGTGRDVQRGGLGAGRFVYGFFSEPGTRALTRDVIPDFPSFAGRPD